MGGGDGPGELDRVAIIEMFNEKEKGIMTMSPQQEDIVSKPEHIHVQNKQLLPQCSPKNDIEQSYILKLMACSNSSLSSSSISDFVAYIVFFKGTQR
jgi:hypothetical protein